MSRLTDLYKRVMYGQAGMDMPGQGMSGGTSGLFGHWWRKIRWINRF
jgi:hypothetical protein